MAKNRQPTAKLSTMRIIWGILAGITTLNSLAKLAQGHSIIAILMLIVAGLLAWYAINPPEYIRKKFIQD